MHLVWSTWDRLPLITPEVERVVYRCLKAECTDLGAAAIEIGGMDDHVHLLVRVPTTVSVATLVKHLKGASSHLVTHAPAPPDFFKWQGGYGAFTISRWDVPRVQRYIQHQREHHTAGTLSATLERSATP